MTHVTVERTVNLPSEQIWPILADFGGAYKFHPLVAHSPLIGDRTTGLGAQRRCEFYDGNHVTEEIVSWDEGRSMVVEITEGSMPLNCATAKIELSPAGPGKTTLLFSMNYEPKFGPLGWVMDKLMLKRSFTSLIGQVIEGVETHGRTGALIGEGGKVIEQAQSAA
jgi:hypothetical protein